MKIVTLKVPAWSIHTLAMWGVLNFILIVHSGCADGNPTGPTVLPELSAPSVVTPVGTSPYMILKFLPGTFPDTHHVILSGNIGDFLAFGGITLETNETIKGLDLTSYSCEKPVTRHIEINNGTPVLVENNSVFKDIKKCDNKMIFSLMVETSKLRTFFHTFSKTELIKVEGITQPYAERIFVAPANHWRLVATFK
jgi:hypothetical protein